MAIDFPNPEIRRAAPALDRVKSPLPVDFGFGYCRTSPRDLSFLQGLTELWHVVPRRIA